VGDPELAHKLVGRLVLIASDYDDGRSVRVGGGSLVDSMAGRVKRYARAPWLYPVSRCFAEARPQD
jgi:hypothetical protein